MQIIKKNQRKNVLIFSHYSCDLQNSIYCSIAFNILRRRFWHLYFK